MNNIKRKDKNRVILKKGEGERPNGTYSYRWIDTTGHRHTLYAKTLKELREKEAEILKNKVNGLRSDGMMISLNKMFEYWEQTKRGIRKTTLSKYHFTYQSYLHDSEIADMKLSKIKKSNVKKLYIGFIENRNLKISTVETINIVLNQIFDLAVDDGYMLTNPCKNILKELKKSYEKTEPRHALSKSEQEAFLNYLSSNRKLEHWQYIFTTMLGTGMRIGEIIGLSWNDVDFNEKVISVNHTLLYGKFGCDKSEYFINPPKSKSGIRIIPLFDNVAQALLKEREYQKLHNYPKSISIGEYSNFIFITKNGTPVKRHAVDDKIKIILKSYNNYAEKNNLIKIRDFSSHSLRHTFSTRLCEADVNIKVIQKILGHANIATTMDIYTEVTKDYQKEVYDDLNQIFII